MQQKKLPNWSHRSIMTFLPHHQLGPKPASSVRYITYLNSKWTQSLFAHVLQLKNVSEQYIRVGTSMQEPLFRYLCPLFRYLRLGTSNQVPLFWYLNLGTSTQIPLFRYLNSGTSVQVPQFSQLCLGSSAQIPLFRYLNSGTSVQVP